MDEPEPRFSAAHTPCSDVTATSEQGPGFIKPGTSTQTILLTSSAGTDEEASDPAVCC